MTSNGPTILLADGNRDDGELIQRAFREAGFDNPIHVVQRGEDAVQYLSGEGEHADRAKFPLPKLVLLAPKINGLDGWEVLQWIRRRCNPVLLPVIMFGGSDHAADAGKALELGANAYEIKPQIFEELVQVVKRIGDFWL